MTLITGASGFLGQHLVRHLSAQGIAIRALYNSHAPSAELAALPGVKWMRCDLLDIFEVEEAMAGMTDVYHCAAIVSFEPGKHDELLHFNPQSTAHVVDQALLQGIRKMVYVSSVAALGRQIVPGKLITEEEEWGEGGYHSAYAISKYLAETEVWRGMGEGLNAVVINPGVILGEGEWDNGSAQLMSVANKEFPFYTNGVNGWVDVADVVQIMQLLMESDVAEERFIVTAENRPFKDVFTMMAGALGKRPPRYYAGPFISGMAWRLGALKHKITGAPMVITRETAKTAHSSSCYDNRKLLETLPSFAYRPLSETIERMAAAFLKGK